MTLTEQRDSARQLANDKRLRIATVRRDLRNGTLSLSSAMSDPPDELLRYPLIDVIRWTRMQGRRCTRSDVEIGRRAVRDGVNLMLSVGDASPRSRAWVAQWGTYRWRPSA